MYAVFVSLSFGPTGEPDTQAITEHHALLRKLPHLVASSSLRRRSEYAFFLIFEDQEDIDRYLESIEFRRLQGCKGCYDVFVRTFELTGATGRLPLEAMAGAPAAAAMPELETPAVLPA